MITLRYVFVGKCYHYQGYTNEEEEVEFEYEVSKEDYVKAINEFYGTKLSTEEVMDNYYNDKYELDLEENEDLEDFLKEYFEDRAYREFCEQLEEDNAYNVELRSMLHD